MKLSHGSVWLGNQGKVRGGNFDKKVWEIHQKLSNCFANVLENFEYACFFPMFSQRVRVINVTFCYSKDIVESVKNIVSEDLRKLKKNGQPVGKSKCCLPFSRSSLSKLKCLEAACTPDDYGVLINCICNWGRVDDVLEVIEDWLKRGFTVDDNTTAEKTNVRYCL